MTDTIGSVKPSGVLMVNDLVLQARLVDARREHLPWHEIARVLQELRASRAHDDRGLPWIAYAGQVSGYTPVALREMIRTFQACEELAAKANLPRTTVIQAVPMYAIEIISRISKLSDEKAIEVLKNYMKKRISVGELKDTYETMRSEHSERASNAVVGRKVSLDFEDTCYKAIRACGNLITSQLYASAKVDSRVFDARVVRWMSKSKRFSPSFAILERLSNPNPTIHALDCALLQGWSEDRIVQRLIYLDFISKSFDRFWLLVPSWSPADHAETLIKELEIADLGLVSVDPVSLDMKQLLRAPCNKDIKRRRLIEPNILLSRCRDFGVSLTETNEDFDDPNLERFVP